MKSSLLIVLIAIFLTACEKNGDISHKVKFTTEGTEIKKSESKGGDFHTGLGSYITSITPATLKGKINVLMYLDNEDQQANGTHMISYVDGHDNDPNYEIAIEVDFSNNQERSYIPILYGTDIRDGYFEQKVIDFKYFYFVPSYFIQEFELPAGYTEMPGQALDITTDPLSGKRKCSVRNQVLQWPIFPTQQDMPFGYLFGNTATTYFTSQEHPTGKQVIVRSHKFVPVTVRMPDAGETIEMYSTISFDTEGLIQVYAGKDNIPYNRDDMFVYAPNYWERIKVNLEVR